MAQSPLPDANLIVLGRYNAKRFLFYDLPTLHWISLNITYVVEQAPHITRMDMRVHITEKATP